MKSFVKDKSGRVALWQTPNPALVAWAVLSILSHLTRSQNLAWLATVFLFTWAFMEIYQGVNYFRRLLGLIVLVLIVIMHFR